MAQISHRPGDNRIDKKVNWKNEKRRKKGYRERMEREGIVVVEVWHNGQ